MADPAPLPVLTGRSEKAPQTLVVSGTPALNLLHVLRDVAFLYAAGWGISQIGMRLFPGFMIEIPIGPPSSGVLISAPPCMYYSGFMPLVLFAYAWVASWGREPRRLRRRRLMIDTGIVIVLFLIVVFGHRLFLLAEAVGVGIHCLASGIGFWISMKKAPPREKS